MSGTITVTLPQDVSEALDDLSRREGISRDELVGRVLREHLFVRRFRLLRDRLKAQAEEQGVVTDQDVFDRVS